MRRTEVMNTLSTAIIEAGAAVLRVLAVVYALCGILSVAVAGYSVDHGMTWQTSVFFGISGAVSCIVAVGLLYIGEGGSLTGYPRWAE